MSVAAKPKSFTLPAQALESVTEASRQMGLDDLKLLSIALTQTAVEGLQRNPSFASHVRDIYQRLATESKGRETRGGRRKSNEAEPELIPVKQVDARDPDPTAPPDPYFLCEMYGAHQLRRALARFKLPDLRLAVKQVQAHNPGTKPGGKNGREDVLDYLVRYVSS